ncbi:MAG: PhzF family phenazine biosynthesis protein [Deltaproteobacteria bacterium]|nr:MAG: PhzF family phenazine biosynthesis protein [Deltaproteobacteria bacterium]
MGVQIFQVDAFTDKPFAGNPAAVCILSELPSETWMQNVAAEMNLSETAFLYEQENGFNLRWFTPSVEVDLCGHATLASAHILWETGLLHPHEQAKFYTRSGLLTAELKGNEVQLDLPATPEEPTTAPADLSDALGVVPNYVGRSKYDYLVEIDSEEAVTRLTPDFSLLGKLPIRGIIVTSVADAPEHDFVCRFFAPAVGVDEDPVTGSAHCCLGPFWSKRFGKSELLAYQASRRGGTMRVIVSGDRVHLRGQAVTVLRGELVDDD